MTLQIVHIARNTFREAVRDRVLYNLIFFALLMIVAAVLFGQISVGIERIVLVNIALAAMSVFGALIAIFVGIGLVSKEIDKRTLYTVLAHPVRRWEFVVGKFCGLSGTLVVNTACMAFGFLLALLYVTHGLTRQDLPLGPAIYFVVLQLVLLTAIALLFSSFSTPVLSAVFSFAVFVIGSFAEDLRAFALMAHGYVHWIATAAAYLVPNFSALNLSAAAAHQIPIPFDRVLKTTLYVSFYTLATISGAVTIFERRDLK